MLTQVRNLSLLKKFSYMHPKGLVFHFQKMLIVYYAMTYCFGDVRVSNQIISLNLCSFSILFNIWIANISWTMAQTSINHVIFWKSVLRTFKCNMWIVLTGLGFLLQWAKNCKECTFLDNLRGITQERILKTRQITSFFHLLFLPNCL